MNETELLFTDILNCSRSSLYLNKDIALDKTKSFFIARALKRRMQGEPIQYILGKTEFMGLEFKVTPEVFIPRPETEILVERVIDIVHSLPRSSVQSMLDIGTGSGCIAISLAKFLKNVSVTAVDILDAALEVAKQNAQLNNVKVIFLQSDLFTGCGLRVTGYDMIISNPPYIATTEINKLQPEIGYEPRIAIDGGRDGLDFYRRIIREAPGFLREDGFLVMEIGFGQGGKIKNILQKSGVFEIIGLVKDYSNIDRVLISKKKEARWIN